MNDKYINLDTLENADEETLKKIAADCPASEEEKEIMFAMSRRIYKERTKESDYKNGMEVSGVEVYKKPKWHGFAAAAAAFVIVAGVVAGGMLLKKNNPVKPPVINSRVEIQACPIGDLESCRMRISTADLEPAVFEPSDEKQRAINKALKEGNWDAEKKEGFTVPDDIVYSSEFSYDVVTSYNKAAESTRPDYLTIFFKDSDNDGRMFMLRLFSDDSVLYDDGTKQERYQLDEETAGTVRKNAEFDPEIYSLIYPEDKNGDLLHSVWGISTQAENNAETYDLYCPVTDETVRVTADSCRFCMGVWNQEDVMTCEADPEVLKVFSQTDWKPATREANLDADGILVSFRCTDSNENYYEYTIHNSGTAIVSYSDIADAIDVKTMTYDIGSDMSIYSSFYGVYEKTLKELTPDRIFSVTEMRSAMISRSDDPGIKTDLNDEEIGLLANAVTSAEWERLPEDTQFGDRIYSLDMSNMMYHYGVEIYSGNTVTINGNNPMRVSDDFITALNSISERVWKKQEPVHYDSLSESEEAELIERASELYEKCIPRYMGFTSGSPSLFYDDTEKIEYKEFGENGNGILIPGVTSIDEIRAMFLEEFSERYHANDIGDEYPYFEMDGKVYSRPGGRGSHIYFQDTEITEIRCMTEDEIIFNVRNYYGGAETDDTLPWVEQKAFSVVVQPDGSWKVGMLSLPY
ncbi:MAG: hypothetical protein IKH78_03335 [Ruminococcus sp.]|nr:hypothetical protein [Ruminococcus sp.]